MSLIAENFSATTIGSSSQANGDELPPDILNDIFIRLPLKAVYKFRCVSKLWNSLLSNTYLVFKVFSITTSPTPWTVVYERDDYFSSNPQVFQTHSTDLYYPFINDHHNGFTFKFLLDNAETFWNNIMSESHEQSERCNYNLVPSVQLLGTCVDGLVLYKLCPRVDLFTQLCDMTFNVCNPLTKQCVSLPPRPDQNSIDCDFVRLVSETSTTSNYKVVYFGYTSGAWHSHTTTLQIFSFGSGEWRTYIVGSYKRFLSPQHSSMVIRSGVLYWIEYTRTPDDYDNYTLVVRAFNLENKEIPKNTLQSIYLPKELKIKSNSDGFFGVLEGSIYYGNVLHTRSLRPGFLNVWLLQDYSNGGWAWQPVHINMEMKYHKVIDDLVGYSLYFHPEDRNAIIFVGNSRCFCLAYNISTGTYEELRGSPIPSFVVSDRPSFPAANLITPKLTRIPSLSPSRGG